MGKLASTISPSITTMNRMDHGHVMTMFHRYKHRSTPNAKKALADTICLALEVHAQLEEEIFYPLMQRLATDQDVVDKSKPEHNDMRQLLHRLRRTRPNDPAYDDIFMALMRDVIHHIAEEETILLPDAERLLSKEELNEWGARMNKRRLELLTLRAGELASAKARLIGNSKLMMAVGAALAGTYRVKRARASSRAP